MGTQQLEGNFSDKLDILFETTARLTFYQCQASQMPMNVEMFGGKRFRSVVFIVNS